MKFSFKLQILLFCLFVLSFSVYAQDAEPVQIGDLGALLSSNGSYLLNLSSDGTATIIDLGSDEEPITIQHGDSLLGGAWNSDTSRILTWSTEGIRLWNANNGVQLLSLPKAGSVGAGWLSNSQIYAWSASSITVWDPQSGDEVANIEAEDLAGISFSTDGNTLIWWNSENNAVLVQLADDPVEVTETTNEPTGETTAAQLIPGKWQVTWGEQLSSCAAIETTSQDRPFIMLVDTENDTFSTEDLFIWSSFNFVYKKNAEGKYVFLRNQTQQDGSTLTFEYVADIISPSRIEGVISDYATGVNCTNSSAFLFTLLDENIQCMVGSAQGANLRSGPGTEFNRLQALGAGVPADVVGYAVGSDNFKWWKLSDDSWVREDVVQEEGYCDTVPEVEP